MHNRLLALVLLACLCAAGGGWITPQSAWAQQQVGGAQKSAMTPREAAAKARAQHGGKVLNVSRQGNAYRVKLLLDSGRVITVTIKG